MPFASIPWGLVRDQLLIYSPLLVAALFGLGLSVANRRRAMPAALTLLASLALLAVVGWRVVGFYVLLDTVPPQGVVPLLEYDRIAPPVALGLAFGVVVAAAFIGRTERAADGSALSRPGSGG